MKTEFIDAQSNPSEKIIKTFEEIIYLHENDLVKINSEYWKVWSKQKIFDSNNNTMKYYLLRVKE